MNASERPSEALEGLSRWEEVLFPSYRIQQPVRPSEAPARPKWLDRLQAKDMTDQIRGEK